MDETQRRQRGHRFTPPRKILSKIPPLYATDGEHPRNKTIWAHYFSAGTDHFVAELSQREEDGHWISFGYSVLSGHPEGAEWGYTDLTELEAVNGRSRQGLPLLVERDCHWEPQPFREARDIPGEWDYPPVPESPARDEPLPQRQPDRAGPARAAAQHECPECGEEAVNQPATDLVPWEAHGIERPEWSHRDGSGLCPVIGASGGYEPAQPITRASEADRQAAGRGPAGDVSRLDPPATLQAERNPDADREGPLYDREGQVIAPGPAEATADHPYPQEYSLSDPEGTHPGTGDAAVEDVRDPVPCPRREREHDRLQQRAEGWEPGAGTAGDGDVSHPGALDPGPGAAVPLEPGETVRARIGRDEHEETVTIHHPADSYGPRYVAETGTGERCMFPPETVAGPEAGTADEAMTRGWSPDGGRHGLFALGDATIENPTDPGPAERQLEDRNTRNDHADQAELEPGA